MMGFGKKRVPFPCGVLGRIWNLIVSAPDHSLLFYLIIAEGYIVVAFPFVLSFVRLCLCHIHGIYDKGIYCMSFCSFVRKFACLFVSDSVPFVELLQSFTLKFLK